MHPLQKTVGGRVESRRAGETDAAHVGQGVEQQRFELPALVSGDGLREIHPDRRAWATISAVMSCSGMASGQHVKRSTVVRQYLKLSDVGSGPKISMCTCWNREVGREKSPSGLVVCQDTFDRWQYWHARAQVRQSFCTPGHTNRWEMSFPVALVPR